MKQGMSDEMTDEYQDDNLAFKLQRVLVNILKFMPVCLCLQFWVTCHVCAHGQRLAAKRLYFQQTAFEWRMRVFGPSAGIHG